MQRISRDFRLGNWSFSIPRTSISIKCIKSPDFPPVYPHFLCMAKDSTRGKAPGCLQPLWRLWRSHFLWPSHSFCPAVLQTPACMPFKHLFARHWGLRMSQGCHKKPSCDHFKWNPKSSFEVCQYVERVFLSGSIRSFLRLHTFGSCWAHVLRTLKPWWG